MDRRTIAAVSMALALALAVPQVGIQTAQSQETSSGPEDGQGKLRRQQIKEKIKDKKLENPDLTKAEVKRQVKKRVKNKQ